MKRRVRIHRGFGKSPRFILAQTCAGCYRPLWTSLHFGWSAEVDRYHPACESEAMAA